MLLVLNYCNLKISLLLNSYIPLLLYDVFVYSIRSYCLQNYNIFTILLYICFLKTENQTSPLSQELSNPDLSPRMQNPNSSSSSSSPEEQSIELSEEFSLLDDAFVLIQS